ncbi:drug resistance transporter, EmrB/QacA subfamily [Tistlia consotensis]|uniref:Drug resistance transporter, EmrB/QacA subfamily n=1 Tax=Tistlia consotensis USBA 355 TaxID=560819 RepID=A0A1Y6CF77_9PROT|nr:MFS transporter [Tistlia consotensis]SMF60348.1 drug resistance transporter, EmrB/QacA subfamily [Tistlia consotensis USBA 355]SNR93506.1 drug resistance transporter, EmrB/QacA subfamily [Tistlia consotensis]
MGEGAMVAATAAGAEPAACLQDPPRGSTAARWRARLALGVLLAGPFMAVMDVFVVNVAVPTIRRDLGASYAEAELVIAGYAFAYALALITGGRLGDIHGRRRVFGIGLTAFTLTSGLCGLATSPLLLVGARLLQGTAAALLFPQAFALIRVAFPTDRERARAFGAVGVTLGLAAIAGQILGGVLVEADLWGLAWRLIFLINLPVGLAAALALPRLVAESRSPEARRLDLAGVGLGALALGLLLYPLIEGREAGWPGWAWAMLAAAPAAFAVFARHQHGKSRGGGAPLLPTGLFRNRAFLVGLLVSLLFYSTLNSFYLAFAFLIQQGLGRSPVTAGLLLTAVGIPFMTSSLLAGRLPAARRRGGLIAGAALSAVACLAAAAVARLAVPLTPAELVPAFVLLGLGNGFVIGPLLNTVLGAIPEDDIGSASGVIATMQQTGGALGIALVGLLFFGILGSARATGLAPAEAYGQGFAAAAAYAAAGNLVTFCLLFLLPRHRP